MAGDTALRRCTVGTFFFQRTFHAFDWQAMARVGNNRSLDELNLPESLLSGVDAACLCPLDDDLVWFFCGDEVVDYRVKKQRPIAAMASFDASSPAALDAALLATLSKRKIKDHPLFGALPPAFHGGVTSVVLDPRTFSDLGGRAGAAPEVTSGDVIVTPTSDGGASAGGGAVVIPAGQAAVLAFSLGFTRPGAYRATATLDGDTDQGTPYSGWTAGVARYGEEDDQPAPAVDYDVRDAPASDQLLVVVQAKGPGTPRLRLTLTITGPSQGATAYRQRLTIFAGQPPDGGLPFVYVLEQGTGCTLYLTSLRTAIAGGPFSVQTAGEVRCFVNRAGPGADRIYQISGGKLIDHPVAGAATAFATATKPRDREPWCHTFPFGVSLQAAVPVALGASPAAPDAATPSGTATIVDPADVDPPETVVAIPGRRPASVTPDLSSWIASLPPCSISAPGGPHAGLVTRMRAFIDRITTQGDLPDFLRTFVAVRVKEGTREICFYAMPDFLAAGSETAFVRLPLTALAGQKVVDWYNAHGAAICQTTARIALRVFVDPDTQRLPYAGMGQDNLSTRYMVQHQAIIEAERARRGHVLGRLTAGHRKEIVVGPGAPPKGVIYWGGVFDVAPGGAWARGTAPTRISVAHPEIAGYPFQDVAQSQRLSIGDPAHTNEPDHDEYAQAQRVVHRWAWFRDTSQGRTWTRKDLFDVFEDPQLSKLVVYAPMPSPRYPSDFDTVNAGKV